MLSCHGSVATRAELDLHVRRLLLDHVRTKEVQFALIAYVDDLSSAQKPKVFT